MNTKLRNVIAVTWVLTVMFQTSAFGHEILVHRLITTNATVSALIYSASFRAFTKNFSTDIPLNDATHFLVDGSDYEDNIDTDEGGKRSYGHFYDPLAGIGLENIPPDDRLKLGVNSFE